MITVDVKRNEAREIVRITMSGHANSGPYGKDLVCAGASAVSIGTIHAIGELCNVDLPVSAEDGGFLDFEVPDNLDQQTREKIQLLLEGMLVSLHSIAREYQKHIRIIDTGRR